MRWIELAECRAADDELRALFFFDGEGASRSRRLADTTCKAICRRCPVDRDCLAYALDHRIEHGIWGGMTAAERGRLALERTRLEQRFAS